jgi:hypothetical protein
MSESITVWLPPGVREDPPVDKRRRLVVLADGPPAHSRCFQWCIEHPGEWTFVCLTDRPEGVCHRIRQSIFAATHGGVFEATQRTVGAGWSRVYTRCVIPPVTP